MHTRGDLKGGVVCFYPFYLFIIFTIVVIIIISIRFGVWDMLPRVYWLVSIGGCVVVWWSGSVGKETGRILVIVRMGFWRLSTWMFFLKGRWALHTWDRRLGKKRAFLLSVIFKGVGGGFEKRKKKKGFYSAPWHDYLFDIWFFFACRFVSLSLSLTEALRLLL